VSGRGGSDQGGGGKGLDFYLVKPLDTLPLEKVVTGVVAKGREAEAPTFGEARGNDGRHQPHFDYDLRDKVKQSGSVESAHHSAASGVTITPIDFKAWW